MRILKVVLATLLGIASTCSFIALKFSFLLLLAQKHTEQPLQWYTALTLTLLVPELVELFRLIWESSFLARRDQKNGPCWKAVLLGVVVSVLEGGASTFLAMEVAPSFPGFTLLLLLHSVLLLQLLADSWKTRKKLEFLSILSKWDQKTSTIYFVLVGVGIYISLLLGFLHVLLQMASIFHSTSLLVCCLVLGLVWCQPIRRFVFQSEAPDHARRYVNLLLTSVRAVSGVTFALVCMALNLEVTLTSAPVLLWQGMLGLKTTSDVLWTCVVTTAAGVVSYAMTRLSAYYACTWAGIALPSLVTTVLASVLFLLGCKGLLPWEQDVAVCPLSGRAVIVLALASLVWLLPLLILRRSYFRPPAVLFRPEEENFTCPSYSLVCFDQHLLCNYCPDAPEGCLVESEAQKPTRVFMCTTMYREADYEMVQLLQSLAKLASSQRLRDRAIQLEAHIFLDNGASDLTLGHFALQLLSLVGTCLGVSRDKAKLFRAPYGLQLSFTLDSGLPLFLHLKDVGCVKAKKRWSQVMYLRYILQHQLLSPRTKGSDSVLQHSSPVLGSPRANWSNSCDVEEGKKEESEEKSSVNGRSDSDESSDLGFDTGDDASMYSGEDVLAIGRFPSDEDRPSHPSPSSSQRKPTSGIEKEEVADREEPPDAPIFIDASTENARLAIPKNSRTSTRNRQEATSDGATVIQMNRDPSAVVKDVDNGFTSKSSTEKVRVKVAIENPATNGKKGETVETPQQQQHLHQPQENSKSRHVKDALQGEIIREDLEEGSKQQKNDSQRQGLHPQGDLEKQYLQLPEPAGCRSSCSIPSKLPTVSSRACLLIPTSTPCTSVRASPGHSASSSYCSLSSVASSHGLDNPAFASDAAVQTSPTGRVEKGDNSSTASPNASKPARKNSNLARESAVISNVSNHCKSAGPLCGTDNPSFVPSEDGEHGAGDVIHSVRQSACRAQQVHAHADHDCELREVTPTGVAPPPIGGSPNQGMQDFSSEVCSVGIEEETPDEPASLSAQDFDERTYILATDADMHFDDESVLDLVERCNQDLRLGACCGRTHPIGKKLNPIVWFQKFEYAKDFWMVKSTQNIIGSVMCCPGCLSLYRAKALAEVVHSYSEPTVKPGEVFTKDTGEDRWMCTLMMLRGWKLSYSADSVNSTYCPDTLAEFLKQRRRWILSDAANSLLVFCHLCRLVRSNVCFTAAFILYLLQLLSIFLLSPGTTIFLMAVGLGTLLKVNYVIFTAVLSALAVLYGLLCMRLTSSAQTSMTKYTVIVLGFAFSAVMIGLGVDVVQAIISDVRSGGMDLQGYYVLVAMAMAMLYAAALHPCQSWVLINGVFYLFYYPAMHLLLPVYSFCNIVDQTWGTRDNQKAKTSRVPCFPKLRICRKKKKSNGKECVVEETAEVTTEEMEAMSKEEDEFWVGLVKKLLGRDVNLGLEKEELAESLRCLRLKAVLVLLVVNVVWIIFLCIFYSISLGGIDSLDVYGLMSGVLFGFSFIMQMVGMTVYRVTGGLRRLGKYVYRQDLPYHVKKR